jgi:hypothetical protein
VEAPNEGRVILHDDVFGVKLPSRKSGPGELCIILLRSPGAGLYLVCTSPFHSGEPLHLQASIFAIRLARRHRITGHHTTSPLPKFVAHSPECADEHLIIGVSLSETRDVLSTREHHRGPWNQRSKRRERLPTTNSKHENYLYPPAFYQDY